MSTPACGGSAKGFGGMKVRISHALTLLLALGAADRAHAQERREADDPLADRFSVSLGWFLVDTSTRVRVDGTARQGSEIDLEGHLGFDDTDRFRVDAYWRFKPRHKLRLLYFDTRRSSSRTIDRDLQFRDRTFTISSEIDARFTTQVAEIAYEYAFLRRERYEVAATLGIHDLRFDLALAATEGQQGITQAESAAANGPLPVVGLRGVWRLSDRWFVDAQAQFFEVSVNPYDGRIEDYNASLVWQALPHVGIGAGYNEFVTRLDVDGSRFDGHLRWQYGGARIFVTASF
jgi:hypothetical protein